MRQAMLGSLLAAFLAAAAPGQSTVVQGAPGDHLTRMMDPAMRPMAAGVDGVLWTLVYREDSAGVRELFLTASADAGVTWSGKYPLPLLPMSTVFSHATLGFDRRCHVLHVLYGLGDPYYSAYHATFDTRARLWTTGPTLIGPKATGTDSQMYGKYVEVTDAGTVVLAIQSHRGPPAGWAQNASGGWAAALVIKRRSDPAFGKPIQVNKELYGVSPNLAAEGTVPSSSIGPSESRDGIGAARGRSAL